MFSSLSSIPGIRSPLFKQQTIQKSSRLGILLRHGLVIFLFARSHLFTNAQSIPSSIDTPCRQSQCRWPQCCLGLRNYTNNVKWVGHRLQILSDKKWLNCFNKLLLQRIHRTIFFPYIESSGVISGEQETEMYLSSRSVTSSPHRSQKSLVIVISLLDAKN